MLHPKTPVVRRLAASALIILFASACSEAMENSHQQFETPGHGALTVEDLANVSDAVVLTSGVTVLKRLDMNDVNFAIISLKVSRVLGSSRSEVGSSVVAWMNEDLGVGKLLEGDAIVFLRLIPEQFDADARAELEAFGGAYLLQSGPSSVLDVRGDSVVAFGDNFYGVESSDGQPVEVLLESGEAVPAEPPQVREMSLAAVLATLSEASVGSESSPTTSVVPAIDREWLSALDRSCLDAKPASLALREILTKAYGGEPLAGQDAVRLFDEMRVDEKLLAASLADVSEGIETRWTESVAQLDKARETLVAAQQLRGLPLQAAIDDFISSVRSYQLVWAGVEVANCKQFV